jgi:hypothetical protein
MLSRKHLAEPQSGDSYDGYLGAARLLPKHTLRMLDRTRALPKCEGDSGTGRRMEATQEVAVDYLGRSFERITECKAYLVRTVTYSSDAYRQSATINPPVTINPPPTKTGGVGGMWKKATLAI